MRNVAQPLFHPRPVPDPAWEARLPPSPTPGDGPRYWSRGVAPGVIARAAERDTIQGFDLGIFEGCTNRVAVSGYMAALRVEATIQGAVAGAVAGAVLTALTFVYLKGKR